MPLGSCQYTKPIDLMVLPPVKPQSYIILTLCKLVQPLFLCSYSAAELSHHVYQNLMAILASQTYLSSCIVDHAD